MQDQSAPYNKKLLETTDLDLIMLEGYLERVGFDVNPRFRGNNLAPFVRTLERDPKFEGKVAGVSFFEGVPVTEDEKERLQEHRQDIFAEVAEQASVSHVIVSVRNMVQSGIGTKAQLGEVIASQGSFREHEDLVWDVFETPEEFSDIVELSREEQRELIDRSMEKVLTSIVEE